MKVRKGFTTRRVPVKRVCKAAENLREVLVLGIDSNGELYAACSSGAPELPVWMAEQFKAKLLGGDYGRAIRELLEKRGVLVFPLYPDRARTPTRPMPADPG